MAPIVQARIRPSAGSSFGVPVGSSGPLDGLQGGAVLAVMLANFHVPGAPGGWIGVETSLVLGGFLATRSLLGEPVDRRGSRRWVAHGLARTMPALLAMLVFVLGWSWVQDGAFTRPVRRAVTSAVLQIYNVDRALGSADGRAFTHLWPVSIGWQCALAAPVVVLVLAGRSRRSAARVIVRAAMLVAVVRTVAMMAGRSPAEVYLVTWFRIDGVLLGVAAAYLHRQLVVTERQQLHRLATPALSVLAGAVVFVPSWSGWPRPSLVLVVPLVSVASFVVVLAIATRSASATVLRVLSAPVLRWIGVRSLSLYLWHYVVGVLLVAGGADHGWDGPGRLARQLGFTAVAALASYEFVERPAARYLLSHPTPPWRR